MTKRLPPATCDLIKAMLKDPNQTSQSIAVTVGTSKRTIERMKRSLNLHGTLYRPSLGKRGRPRVLTAAQEAFLLEFFKENPEKYLHQLAEEVQRRFGVEIGGSTIHQYLSRRGLTLKRAS